MNRIGDQGTHTKYRLEGVGPWTQMGYCPKIFEAVAFRLNRIIRCGRSFNNDFLRLNFKRLFGLRRRHQCSFNDDCGTYIQLTNILEIIHCFIKYDLKGLKISSVVNHKKSESLGIS